MSWTLVIDYGTSRTTAAIVTGDAIEQLELDDERYMPSLVCLDEDGHLLAGRIAANMAAVLPERTERVPKRAVLYDEDVLLGDRRVLVTDLIAAVLARVAEKAARRCGGEAPVRLVLTHPAHREHEYLKAFTVAAQAAGLPNPEFVSEPEAAALWYARNGRDTALGEIITVFDFGGGTLDVAVLRRSHNGFFLAGPPGGDSLLGGEDVDEAMLELIGRSARATDSAAWSRIFEGDATRQVRMDRAAVRKTVTDAKHELSDELSSQVYLPGFSTGFRVTRAELDRAMSGIMDRAIAVLLGTIEKADVGKIATIYLTGGSSRIPLVHDAIAQRLGVDAQLHHDPKSVVVIGAAYWAVSPPRVASNASQLVAGYRKLLNEQLRDLGPEHPDTLRTRRHIAYYTGEAGDVTGAIALLKELLPVQTRMLGPVDRAVFAARFLIAGYTGVAGFPREAGRQFTALLDEYEANGMLDQASLLQLRASNAYWLGEAGDHAEAVALLEEVIAEYLPLLGHNHPDTLSARMDYAEQLNACGDHATALALSQDMVPQFDHAYGADHRQTLGLRHDIACYLAGCDAAEEARDRWIELLPDQERILGLDDPDILLTRYNIASTSLIIGDYAAGIIRIRELLPDDIRLLGHDDPDTLRSRMVLAELTYYNGETDTAITTLAELVEDMKRALEPGHEYLVYVQELLASWTTEQQQ